LRKDRKALKVVEWLGQTVASLAWIISVFLYGISSTADVLQLAAASSWMVANIATALDTWMETHRPTPPFLPSQRSAKQAGRVRSTAHGVAKP
jgi:hypothetical protein